MSFEYLAEGRSALREILSEKHRPMRRKLRRTNFANTWRRMATDKQGVWAHRDGKGYGVTLNFIPRSPDAELVIRAIKPKPAAQAGA
jgi:hypothetical protein